jgi:Cytochrome c7 and related cytochrome c
MRLTSLRIGAFAAVATVALGWTLSRTALPAAEPTRASPQGSSVFTPAHRTLRDAVMDFFNRHREPVQPIAFTHKVHLANGLHCTDCHVGVDQGPDARIPGVSFCMTCHQVIATDKPEIQKLAAYQKRGEDIPWQRVYDYSPTEHIKFNHAPHIRAGVDCATCHGDMRQRTVAVRTVNMTMGFCLDCHEQRKASVDCTTCHF